MHFRSSEPGRGGNARRRDGNSCKPPAASTKRSFLEAQIAWAKPVIVRGLRLFDRRLGHPEKHFRRESELLAVEHRPLGVELAAEHDLLVAPRYRRQIVPQATVESDEIVHRLKGDAAIVALHRELQPDHLERARPDKHQSFEQLAAANRHRSLARSCRAIDVHHSHPNRPTLEA